MLRRATYGTPGVLAICPKNAISFHEAAQLLAQSPHDVTFRQVDRVLADAQVARDFGGGPSLGDELPARLPGRVGKIGLHQPQGPAGGLAVVLAFPEID